MEKNSQPPAPAAPAKVTPPANEAPKTTQASSNHELVPMAARTAATDGSSSQPQCGTAVESVPLRSVQQQPQGHPLPRSPTAVGFLPYRPVQQPNPVVFGQGSSSSTQAMQGSSSSQAVAATALVVAMHGPAAQRGAAVPWLPAPGFFPAPRVVRPKLMIMRPPAPLPPKVPVYRPPPPPRAEHPSSSAAVQQSSLDTGICVTNMQADPPSPDQVTIAEEGCGSDGGGGSGEHVGLLDLNFPPVSDDKEN